MLSVGIIGNDAQKYFRIENFKFNIFSDKAVSDSVTIFMNKIEPEDVTACLLQSF